MSSLILLFTLAAANFVVAQDRREVILITIGPGDQVWEKFGHNMIWIRDPSRNIDYCYNWGLFDFDEPGFVGRFVQGRMTYWMDAFSPRSLEVYYQQKRHVFFDRITLTEAQIDDLLIRCETNRLPENQRYKYDYFRDNCSTRVRDMLNEVTGGQLKREIDAQTPPDPMSYRQHSMRLMQDDLLLSLGVDFALGPLCDRKLTAWEEGFLPTRLHAYSKPLLTPRPALWESHRPPEPTVVPDRRFSLLCFGLAMGAGLVGLAFSPWRRVRRLAAGMAGGWWLLAGVGAIFMSYIWLFTDHAAGYANQNLMQFSPLALMVLPLWWWMKRKSARREAGREERRESPTAAAAGDSNKSVAVLLVAIAALGLIGLGGHLAGLFSQANLGFILLAIPLNAASSLTVWRSLRQHRLA